MECKERICKHKNGPNVYKYNLQTEKGGNLIDSVRRNF